MTPGSRLGTILTITNLALSLLCTVAAGLEAAGAGVLWTRDGQPLDYALYVLAWSYLLATPLLAGAALLLGDRRTALVRANYAVVGLWFVFFAWTVTLTL